ncbi:hypothetical protein M9H77_12323 [Catharanthus roseus]|uniref:Uncharacterized protein n=1 Tax=Catharanthus roseus TaxID=4058 RepID=A0ACC0BH07_CATRO|nr:hypothetical protein M9H77_12323 [Catharanthus roseus]
MSEVRIVLAKIYKEQHRNLARTEEHGSDGVAFAVVRPDRHSRHDVGSYFQLVATQIGGTRIVAPAPAEISLVAMVLHPIVAVAVVVLQLQEAEAEIIDDLLLVEHTPGIISS